MSESCPWGVAGTAYFKVDGTQLALKGNLTVSIDTFERETVAGMDGIHGYTQKPRAPYIEGDFSDIGSLSLMMLQSMCNVTVTVELMNGKVYLLRNAWTTTARELKGEDGTVTVRWDGMSGEELMP